MKLEDVETYSVKLERQFKDGPVVRESWVNERDELHRTNGPAFQLFDEATGTVLRREYRLNGINMRSDGPCAETWDKETGELVSQVWGSISGAHREHGKPASITRCPNSGLLLAEEYLENGLHHREGGPSVIHRDPETGIVTFEEHHVQGLLHRDDDLPAHVRRDPTTGVVTLAEYYVQDSLHRNTGPARIIRDPNSGQISEVEFFENGERLEPFSNSGDPSP